MKTTHLFRLIAATALICAGNVATGQQTCPQDCQAQIDKLNRQLSGLQHDVADLQSRLPVFEAWRPASGSSSDVTHSLTLKLTPDFVIVTLFEWDWHRVDRPVYRLDPMPMTLVAQRSTGVIEVPKQELPPMPAPKFFVDAPCRVFVMLNNKTLSYTSSACPAEGSSPVFNLIFMFTASSKP
jgi:hypothetical protein